MYNIIMLDNHDISTVHWHNFIHVLWLNEAIKIHKLLVDGVCVSVCVCVLLTCTTDGGTIQHTR